MKKIGVYIIAGVIIVGIFTKICEKVKRKH